MSSHSSSQRRSFVLLANSSAGELEWSLPLALACNNKRIVIVALSISAERSIERNEFIRKCAELSDVKLLTLGGVFAVPILFSRPRIVKRFYSLLTRLESKIFCGRLRAKIGEYQSRLFANLLLGMDIISQAHVVFCEHPSADHIIMRSLTKAFPNALAVYHPHSPHVYNPTDASKTWLLKPLDRNSLLNSEKTWCTGSCFGDPEMLGKHIKEPKSNLVIGWPRYAIDLTTSNQDLSITSQQVNKLRVAVFTRGVGSYISKDMHVKQLQAFESAVYESLNSIDWVFKFHPREKHTACYKNILNLPNCVSTEKNAQSIISTSDLVIVMWSSVALDAYFSNKPCIEFFNHKDSKEYQEMRRGVGLSQYTSSYKDLKIVINVDSGSDLNYIINDFQNNPENYSVRSNQTLEFYRDRGREFIREFSSFILSNNNT